VSKTKKEHLPTGLDLLRAPFPENQISKLPKPTKRQTEEVKSDYKKGVKCDACGGWHHPKVAHLDYVGHAALTNRLLDVDQNWNWEPLSYDDAGNPTMDSIGGMWIKLHVCGVTRLGYGHPDGKTGGNAIKEVIGDALRNAAMRFGAALDLWHKGELHLDATNDDAQSLTQDKQQKKAWNGPLNEKSLKEALSAFNDEIMASDSDNIDELAVRNIDIMNQCAVDLPTWAEAMQKKIKAVKDARND